ncbi:hypothetical protein TNIN_494561 [Trichonephila inaurata madagascariensis]|uniref:Uncharacterized protein n=1 Tax=Trichonephila inaurata madagascariensis TaxID=2747483 RepID=A0A8X6X2C2_9ARAC|nr:hypothetical protein TNIN_494561 [Trichonephila inaurata madagascariensis]
MMSQIIPFITKAGFLVTSESSASLEDEDNIEVKKKIWIQLKEKEESTNDMLLDGFLSLDFEAETYGLLTK